MSVQDRDWGIFRFSGLQILGSSGLKPRNAGLAHGLVVEAQNLEAL